VLLNHQISKALLVQRTVIMRGTQGAPSRNLILEDLQKQRYGISSVRLQAVGLSKTQCALEINA
jgi:hypothetical protein